MDQRPFKIILKADSAIDMRFYATNDSGWQLILDDDHPLTISYYTDTEYNLSTLIFYLGMVLSISALLVCILGIFSPHKLAGL